MHRREFKTRRAPVDRWVVFTTPLFTRSRFAKPEFIMRSDALRLLTAILTLAAALGLGCAQLPQAHPLAVTTFDGPALAVSTFNGPPLAVTSFGAPKAELEAQGPGFLAGN
jgi:hypothetical protein